MRRALRRELPALSRIYGIKGADLADMPFGEIESYLLDLRAIAAAQGG